MDILSAVILSIIQGVTEFLPISSKGHLTIAESFIGSQQKSVSNLSFFTLLHFGSLIAILFHYRRELIKLLKSRSVVILYIIIATIPVGATGLILRNHLKSFYENPIYACCGLIVTGVTLLIAEYKSTETTNMSNMGFKKSLLIGFAQIIALLPGVSRSGTVLSASFVCGINRVEAVGFTFFLGIPVILGACILEGKDLITNQAQIDFLPIIIGISVTFIVSLFAINIVKVLAAKKRLVYFSMYCFVAGVSLLIYFLIK